MGVWRADDIEELREVYSSCKDDVDVITGMIHLMRKRRPRHKIANKMIELGIITDRFQCLLLNNKKHHFHWSNFLISFSQEQFFFFLRWMQFFFQGV